MSRHNPSETFQPSHNQYDPRFRENGSRTPDPQRQRGQPQQQQPYDQRLYESQNSPRPSSSPGGGGFFNQRGFNSRPQPQMQTEDPHAFRRQMQDRFFEDARNQDPFFGRASPSFNGFQRPGSSGFPRGFDDFDDDRDPFFADREDFARRSRFPEMRFPDSQGFAGGFQQPQQQQQQREHPQARRYPSNGSASSEKAGGEGSMSIPIRVIHEAKDGGRASPRNIQKKAATVEINKPEGQGSPRVTRAYSAPPEPEQNQHQPRFHPNYNAIPEGKVDQSQMQIPTMVHSGLQPPPRSPNLSKTKSAPNVPSSPRTASQQEKLSQQEVDQAPSYAPPPPPPPRQQMRQQPHQTEDDLRKQSAPPSVRHIPIFIEGRSDPVPPKHKSMAAGDGMSKPSEFYPAGTRKVARGQEARPRPTFQQEFQKAAKSDQRDGGQEPTSPISPPPADFPIPMGYVPNDGESNSLKPNQQNQEPTTPVKAQEGVPIPLPCSPDHYNNNNNDEKKVEEPRKSKEPTPQPEEPKAEPEQPQPQTESDCKALNQVEKIRRDVAELVKKIDAFKGSKKDKEYLYLDEMLTRHLIALDAVDSGGRDDIRAIRKESIKMVNRCLSLLDNKVKQQSKEGAENDAVLAELVKQSQLEEKS